MIPSKVDAAAPAPNDLSSSGTINVDDPGTAAVVTPVGTVLGPDGEFTIGGGGIGQMTHKIREKLVGIQKGAIEDTHGWTVTLD